MTSSRIVLFCHDTQVADLFADTRPAAFAMTRVDNGADFRDGIGITDGALVYTTEAVSPAMMREVAVAADKFPLKTIVMAAQRGVRMTPYVEEYVEVPRRVDAGAARYVWNEYYYAWVRVRMHMLSLGLSQAGLSPVLSTALSCALRRRTPVTSVDALVALTGVNRKTLWRHWDAEVQPVWPVRLLDVLDWITLVHFAARKTPERTWASLADWVGLDVRTLGRQANRLTGYTLTELAGLDREDVFRAFKEEFGKLLRGA